MSVTFTAGLGPIIGTRIECGCGAFGPQFAEFDAASEWLGARQQSNPASRLEGCTSEWCAADCLFVVPLEEDPSPQVNLSNFNARFVLAALGVDSEDLCGEDGAESFLGRVLTALAIAPVDEGVPAHDLPGPGAQVVECGRRAGYLQERLAVLHEVALWAVERGRCVQWA